MKPKHKYVNVLPLLVYMIVIILFALLPILAFAGSVENTPEPGGMLLLGIVICFTWIIIKCRNTYYKEYCKRHFRRNK